MNTSPGSLSSREKAAGQRSDPVSEPFPGGTAAPMPETKEIISLCRLRSTLEAFAVVQLRQRGEWNATRESLQPFLQRLRFAAERADFPNFHKADFEFHRTLVEKSGQPFLTIGVCT